MHLLVYIFYGALKNTAVRLHQSLTMANGFSPPLPAIFVEVGSVLLVPTAEAISRLAFPSTVPKERP